MHTFEDTFVTNYADWNQGSDLQDMKDGIKFPNEF